MKTCPYCMGEIPDQAKKCKYCGEWVIENEDAFDKKEKIDDEDELDDELDDDLDDDIDDEDDIEEKSFHKKETSQKIENKKGSYKITAGVIIMIIFFIIVVAGAIIGYFLGGNNNTINDDKKQNYDNNSNLDSSIYDNVIEDTDVAIEYNDAMVDAATECVTSEDTVRNTFDDESSSIEDIKSTIDYAVSQCNMAINKVKNLGDFDGDGELKNGVIKVLEGEVAYYSKFKEILPYIENGDDEAYNKVYAELEELDAKLSEANDNLITIQDNFSKRHGYTLEESD